MKDLDDFFAYNGYPQDGFVIDTESNKSEKIVKGYPNFPDLDLVSKHGHFYLLKSRYGVEYQDILSFDDDEKYFTKKGLGPAEDVYVAGVLQSKKVEDQGIRMSLFKRGLAYYIFDRLQ